MLNTIFQGLFDSTQSSSVPIAQFLFCISVAIGIGLIIALVHRYRQRYTKSFLMTVATLPAVVCVVIMMVNGNIGAGIAVTGAFSLVRFRSVPGSAREIGTLFLAMSAGMICGMGYLGYAVLFTLVLSVIMLLYARFDFGTRKNNDRYKTLLLTIPEDLNYEGVFDDIFKTYTSKHELQSVKTTNMGSLFRLNYDLIMKNIADEKAFIDQLRVRNGNLEITLIRQAVNTQEL